MGLLRKIKKGLKKVVKLAAPIAAGMIPGIGPIASNIVGGLLSKSKGVKVPFGGAMPQEGMTLRAPRGRGRRLLRLRFPPSRRVFRVRV